MKGLKEYKKEKIISMLFTMLPAFVGLILWNRLPEAIPTHFNINGEADQYSSKLFTVLFLPAFLLVIDCIGIFATFNDPKKENIGKKNFTLVLWITPLVSLYISYLIYGCSKTIIYLEKYLNRKRKDGLRRNIQSII